jgi:pyruvate/2-oxoglutarate dehydrogenase complex dihydrolipoamide dehydrogenase (E3) component
MRDSDLFGARPQAAVSADMGAVVARVRRVRNAVGSIQSASKLRALGIDVYFGAARFVGRDAVEVGDQQLRFKKAIIATGSRSKRVEIPGLNEAGFLQASSAFEFHALPSRMLVIGGGPNGCQTAQALARFGTHTIIAMREPLFLPGEERDAAAMISDALARDGVEIHLNTEATRVDVKNGQKLIELVNDGETTTVTVDEIFVGLGREPSVQGLDLERAGVAYDDVKGIHVNDFLRTSNRRIYAVGDVCLEPRLTSVAYASARLAVLNALFMRRKRFSALTIPRCSYTDPEIAHVGMYVREARERGVPVKTFTVPLHEVDRAIIDGEIMGFVKIHVRDGTGRILGATIVARHAGEMISELSLAIFAGVRLESLAQVLRAYPTQAEAIRLAADRYRATRMRWFRRWLARAWLTLS